MNKPNTSAANAAPQPDRMIPIALIEFLLMATGFVYYFWIRPG